MKILKALGVSQTEGGKISEIINISFTHLISEVLPPSISPTPFRFTHSLQTLPSDSKCTTAREIPNGADIGPDGPVYPLHYRDVPAPY